MIFQCHPQGPARAQSGLGAWISSIAEMETDPVLLGSNADLIARPVESAIAIRYCQDAARPRVSSVWQGNRGETTDLPRHRLGENVRIYGYPCAQCPFSHL